MTHDTIHCVGIKVALQNNCVIDLGIFFAYIFPCNVWWLYCLKAKFYRICAAQCLDCRQGNSPSLFSIPPCGVIVWRHRVTNIKFTWQQLYVTTTILRDCWHVTITICYPYEIKHQLSLKNNGRCHVSDKRKRVGTDNLRKNLWWDWVYPSASKKWEQKTFVNVHVSD